MALTPMNARCTAMTFQLNQMFGTLNRYNTPAVTPMLTSAANRAGLITRMQDKSMAKYVFEGNRKVYFRHIMPNCSEVTLKPVGCGMAYTAQVNSSKDFELDFGTMSAFTLSDPADPTKSLVLSFDALDLTCDRLSDEFMQHMMEYLTRLSNGANAAIVADLISQVGKTWDGSESYRVPFYTPTLSGTVNSVVAPLAAANLRGIRRKERSQNNNYMLLGGDHAATFADAANLRVINGLNYREAATWNGDVIYDPEFDNQWNGDKRMIYYPQGQAQIIQLPYAITQAQMVDNIIGNFTDALGTSQFVFPFRLPNGLVAEITVWREQSGPKCNKVNFLAEVYAMLVTVPVGLSCGGNAANNGIVFVDDCSATPNDCAVSYAATVAITKSAWAPFPANNRVKSPFGSNAVIGTGVNSREELLRVLNTDPSIPAGATAVVNEDFTSVTYSGAAASITTTANVVILV